MTIEIPESNMELTDSAAVPVVPSPETPPTDPKVEVPVDPAPEVPVVPAVEETLYDLPDGRKVNADGLKKEYENLLPEFTRKSQRLAELEGGKDIKVPPADEPKWKKADYVPENYAEVIEIAKQEAKREIAEEQTKEAKKLDDLKTAVEGQLTEIRKTDPKLDENALFQHANKYGFSDLKAAHSNMADMKKAALDAEQRTVKNIKTREADPIAGGPEGSVDPDDGYDPSANAGFGSAVEFLARIKQGGKK